MIKRLLLGFIFLLCSVFYSFSVESIEKDLLKTNDTLFVGISVLKGEGLSIENNYLTQSLPLLILDFVSLCKTRFLTLEEKEEIRKRSLEKEMFNKKKELSELYREMDNLFFKTGNTGEERERLNGKISITQKRIEDLENLDLKDVFVVNTKKVEICKGNTGGKLLPLPLIDPAGLSEKNDLDLLISGNLEEIEGFVYLELFIYSTTFNKNIYEYRDAAEGNELYNILNNMSADIITVILGREWASVAVNTDPDYSTIYINDKYQGNGNIDISFIEPGDYKITVSAQGYKSKILQVDLVPFDQVKLDVQLEEEESDYIIVNSSPNGADVYISSLWEGRTPVMIKNTGTFQQIILKKEYYRTYSYYISEDTPENLWIRMSPDILDPSEYLRKKRDNFYSAFGIFFLSVPFTSICFSLADEYGKAANSEKTEYNETAEYDRLCNLSEIFNGFYKSGVFITAALFVNTVIKIVDYLNTADIKEK